MKKKNRRKCWKVNVALIVGAALASVSSYSYAQEEAKASAVPSDNDTVIFKSHTGHLLKAGTMHTSSSLDTSGGFASSVGFGLGGVADFRLSTLDSIREKIPGLDESSRVSPYITATFKVGVEEDRLFEKQPALALGFRKSFEHQSNGYSTQMAQLYLVASQALGSSVKVHVGASMWDASIKEDGWQGDQKPTAVYLHDQGFKKMVRPFGGLEIKALPRSDILIEFDWVPEYVYETKKTELNAMLAWGVRYRAVPWLHIKSGVRIPEIQTGSLLGAQIFVQADLKYSPFEKWLDANRRSQIKKR